MLFRKVIEPHCAYCSRGTHLSDETIACTKRGIVPAAGSCSKFCYDPLKRVPPVPSETDFSALDREDFSL